MTRPCPERHYPAAAALFLFAFLFYTYTMAPGLMPGDTGDMVQAAASLREAHPPGYPLFKLVAKPFIALPVGDIPYRANLMAAFLGGVSVAFVFLTVALLTRHLVAAAAAALLYATNYLFWTYFTLAETFCLNNACLAVTAFLALLWRERHRREPGAVADRQTLALLAFVAGLSIGNHHTMVLTFPGLLLFAVAVDRTVLRPTRLLKLLALFALGLILPYGYLAAVGVLEPYHFWEDPSTLRGLWHLFLRAKYGTFQLAPGKGAAVTPADQALSYFGALATQFLWVGFLLGIVGLVLAAFRDRGFLLYSGLGFLFGVLFILKANIDPKPTAYDAATLERFYQLPNFFFLLWAGFGAGVLARELEEHARRSSVPEDPARPEGRAGKWVALAVAIALFSMPVWQGVLNFPKANLRGNYLYPRFMENILGTLPPNAILLTWTDTVGMGADYLQSIEKRRPDVAHVIVGIISSEPYKTTVRRKYPYLFWPGPKRGISFDIGRFIHQNLPSHRIFLDGLPMPIQFPVSRYGLVYEVHPAGSPPSIDQVVRANNDLWRRYDLRQVKTNLYPANSMCYSVVVFYYLQRRFSLGAEMIRFGRFHDALHHLRACVEMDPYGYVANSPPWHRQMAEAYIGLNQLKQALEHLHVAREAAPEEADTYRLLARVYHKMGEHRTAARWQKEYEAREKPGEEEGAGSPPGEKARP
ncbi:MAG: DUF2723 domain-containing protein [Armatimonadota bacterium]|nr:DUF2723 domain-containing protein [Armatimonadota bacterium]